MYPLESVSRRRDPQVQMNELCLADAIIAIQMSENYSDLTIDVNDFEILVIYDIIILSLTCSKAGIYCANKNRGKKYNRDTDQTQIKTVGFQCRCSLQNYRSDEQCE